MRLGQELIDELGGRGLMFPIRPRYRRETCASGLARFEAVGHHPEASTIIRVLAKQCPAHLIVDCNKLKQPPPAQPHYLFNWLPDEAAAAVSPVIITGDDLAVVLRWVDIGWGKDGLVVVFSNTGKEDLLVHLRRVARSNGRDPIKPHETPPEGMFAFYWPSVLNPVLMHATQPFVDFVLSGVEAFLLEGGPAPWQAFSGAAFTHALDALGFDQMAEPSA